MATKRRPRPVSGAGGRRGAKLQGKALREAVRIRCLAEFQERLGVAWDPKHERRRWTRPVDNSLERRARKMHQKLREIMAEAEGLANEARAQDSPLVPVGRAGRWLAGWVPEHLSPLLRHAVMDPPVDWGELREEARSRIVYDLDRYLIVGNPNGRALTAREMALVTLLCGSWPSGLLDTNAYTVSDVIRREEKAIGKTITRHGVQSWERG